MPDLKNTQSYGAHTIDIDIYLNTGTGGGPNTNTITPILDGITEPSTAGIVDEKLAKAVLDAIQSAKDFFNLDSNSSLTAQLVAIGCVPIGGSFPQLATPANFAAAPVSGIINLTFTNDVNANLYTIQRDTSSSFSSPLTIYVGTYQNVGDANGLVSGTTYYYRIMSSAAGFTDSIYSTTSVVKP